MQKSFDHRNFFHTYASIFVLVLIAALISSLFWNLMLPRKDFYNELWGPAYLLVHGLSPYDTASLHPVLPAAWLPMAIGFFFPLGWVSEVPALQIWYLFNILEICLIVYLVQGANRNLYDTVALTMICLFFPLTLNHINLGQFSITVALSWVLSVFLLEKNQRWAAALCIALALSKPHLGLLPMLGLSYHDFRRSGLWAMLSLWTQVILMCFLLCIPLFVGYPNWIPDALRSMGSNLPWAYPSLYILFERYLGTWGQLLWAATTSFVIAVNFWLGNKFPLKNAMYWSLALAPLATPYVGSWDFVVLFPLLIFTYVSVDWKRKIFIWMMYGLAWYGMARIQMLKVSHNHYFWWVPLWFVAAIILVTDWRVHSQEEEL